MPLWLLNLLEFSWGGADASPFQKVLRVTLICCTVFCMAQLLAMWGTRWGDRKPTLKAFALSVLLHLSLGIGCTVVADAHRTAALATHKSQPTAQRVSLREIRMESPREFPEDQSPRQPLDQRTVTQPTELERTVRAPATTPETPTPERQRSQVVATSRQVPRTVDSAQFSVTDNAPDVIPEQPLPTPIRSPASVDAQAVAAEIPQAEARSDIEFAVGTPQRRSLSNPTASNAPLVPERARREPQSAADRQIALSRDLLGTPTATASVVPRESPRNLAAAEASGRRFMSASSQSPPTAEESATTPTLPVNGLLAGLVTDADTGKPLAGAMILIDQADQPDLSASTQASGNYRLGLTELPDNVAVTVVRPGYLPESRNLRAADVRGKSSRLNFALRPATESVIPVEEAPEVHHLGNNVFAGEINSQFQRKAEGTVVSARFPITKEQLQGKHAAATVTMLVKGMQCKPILRVNGVVLTQPNTISPGDGSFGTFMVRFNPSLLFVGNNHISVQTTESDGDLDDFEFVNVQIRLIR